MTRKALLVSATIFFLGFANTPAQADMLAFAGCVASTTVENVNNGASIWRAYEEAVSACIDLL